MNVTQLVDRYGSGRMNAAEPGKLLRGCTAIHVPFAGGLCEVPHFTANIVNVNDLDRHIMNLARVVRDRRAELVARLNATPFHPDVLAEAQAYCRMASDRPCGDFHDHDAQTFIVPDPAALPFFLCSLVCVIRNGATSRLTRNI